MSSQDLSMKFLFFVLVAAVPCTARNYNPFFNSVFENDLNELEDRSDDALRDFSFREVENQDFDRIPGYRHNSKRRVVMGFANEDCDDAKTNLDVDWDGSPVNYTCYTPKLRLPVLKNLRPLLECENVPEDYVPEHVCMDHRIEYRTPYPTHASHRPLWAQFGEYVFVPPQRWSHNVEHGAVVMLYHPCAHPHLVEQLKEIVRSCVWKHVITPSNLIPIDRPLVLVTWGCRLRMSTVNERFVKSYIRSHALKGPEGTYAKQGQYTALLLHPAEPPVGSSYDDHHLCPKLS